MDSKGIPLSVCLSSGNTHDCRIFKENKNMITNSIMDDQYFLADEGYDSDEIRNILMEKGYKPIISRRKTKKHKNH